MKRAMQKRTRQKLKEELPPGILSPGAKRDKKETRSSFRSKTSHFLLPHAPPLRAPIPILPLLLAFLYPILILSTEVPLEYRSIITPIRAIGSYISDDELSNCKNNLIHADTDGNDGLSFLEYPTFLFKQSDGKLSYNNDDNVMPLSFVATFNIVACASCSAEESCCADRELNLVIPSENGDDPETNFLLNICTYMNKKISQVLQADLQTKVPSPQPSYRPSIMPTVYPSPTPSAKPTSFPTPSPTKSPTAPPTTYPSRRPTSKPTQNPTTLPTTHPSRRETSKPTLLQSPQSYSKPTPQPTVSPTLYPTCIHLLYPSFEPSEAPTPRLTLQPTSKPLFTKEQPSSSPNSDPTTLQPTFSPTAVPTRFGLYNYKFFYKIELDESLNITPESILSGINPRNDVHESLIIATTYVVQHALVQDLYPPGVKQLAFFRVERSPTIETVLRNLSCPTGFTCFTIASTIYVFVQPEESVERVLEAIQDRMRISFQDDTFQKASAFNV